MIKNLLFILPLSFLFFSCEKELDFKYHKIESQFVIEGTLSENYARVQLSYTTPMEEPFIHEPVIDGEVTLTDQTDNITYTLHLDNGVFCNAIHGIPNHNYELSIIHKGKNYKSVSMMRKGVEILDLKLQWIKMPYDHVAILEIISTVSEIEGTCYWTRIYKNGVPYKWLMSHGSGAIEGKLSQTTFTTRQNPEDENDRDNLQSGDLLNVEVIPISLDMYDYLVGISSDSNGPQMFSGDFCLGYFLASEVAKASIIFNREEIPYNH